MEINEFKKGNTAWELDIESGRWVNGVHVYRDPNEVTITSVGKKYVHTSDFRKFEKVNYPKQCLAEKVIYGCGMYLFQTKEQADDFVLQERLSGELRDLVSNGRSLRRDGITTKQLSAIIAMLKNPNGIVTETEGIVSGLMAAGYQDGLRASDARGVNEVVIDNRFVDAYLFAATLARRIAAGDIILLDQADTAEKKSYFDRLVESCKKLPARDKEAES